MQEIFIKITFCIILSRLPGRLQTGRQAGKQADKQII